MFVCTVNNLRRYKIIESKLLHSAKTVAAETGGKQTVISTYRVVSQAGTK